MRWTFSGLWAVTPVPLSLEAVPASTLDSPSQSILVPRALAPRPRKLRRDRSLNVYTAACAACNAVHWLSCDARADSLAICICCARGRNAGPLRARARRGLTLGPAPRRRDGGQRVHDTRTTIGCYGRYCQRKPLDQRFRNDRDGERSRACCSLRGIAIGAPGTRGRGPSRSNKPPD
jgi:hypothetical protein